MLRTAHSKNSNALNFRVEPFRGGIGGTINSSGQIILLVEDERLIALTETRKLEQAGYRVIHSSTGESAIEIVNGNPSAVDLILMDIDLGPGIDGTEAARAILRIHDVPIVFLSSHMETEIVKKTEEISNYGYVVKSSVFTVLDASIKMAFRLFQAKKQLQSAYDGLALHENLFRMSPNAVCVTRVSDGVYKDVNQSFSRLFGFTREEAIGRSCFSGDLGIWIHQEEREKLAGRLREEGGPLTFEMDFRRKDGTVVMTAASADLISIDGEDYVTSSMRDISEIKRGELELRESEERYRVLFEEAGAGILIYDRDLRILDANKLCVQMFEYSKEELLSFSLTQLDPDLADPVIIGELAEVILESGPYKFNAKRRLKNGTIFPVEVNAMSIVWQGKNAIMAIVRDIAEQEEKQREYAKTQAILRSIMESQSEVLIVGIDKDYKCLYFNQKYQDIQANKFGLKIRIGDSLLGNLPKDIFLKRALSPFQVALAGKSSRMIEEYRDLGMVYDSVFNPIWGRNGEIVGASAVFIDITERMALAGKLRESEERFRLAMEASKDAIWDIDIGKSQVYFNPAYSSLFGYNSVDSAFINTWPAYFHSDEFIELSPIIRDCIENRRQEFDIDYRAIIKDGSSRWLNVCGKVVERDSKGSATRLLGTIHDISERKAAELELLEKESQLKTIGDNTPAFLGILDANSLRFQYVNRMYESSLGLPKEQILGKTIGDVAGDDNYQNAAKYLDEALQGHRTSYERQFSLAQGAVWAHMEYIPQFDDDGKVERILILGVDMTDLKNAAAALEKSEERFRLAMDAADEGIWDHDLLADEIYYSPAYYQIVGRGAEEIGKPLGFEKYVHPDDRARSLSAMYDCIENRKEDIEFDYRMQTEDGAWKWIYTHGKAVRRDSSGKATRLIGTSRDITERKQSEQEIRQLLREKELILREVHHRIKNNLQIVASILSIRVADSSDEKVNSSLNEAIGEIESMSLLYDQLYRSEYTGTMPLRDYFPELLSQAVQVFGNEMPVAIEIDIEDISLDVGKLSRLGIVVNELITNSVKYAFSGIASPTITLRAQRRGDRILLEYADNGLGLPESFSLQNAEGFGMQLIQAMMQQIGGAITAETRKGARFTLEFAAR